MAILTKYNMAPLLPFLFFTGGILYSDILLELGAYSVEIGEKGYHTLGWLRLLFYSVLSVLLYIVFVHFLGAKNQPQLSKIDRLYIVIIFTFCIIYYSFPVFYHGPSFALGLNRYQYMKLEYVSTFNIKLFLGCACVFLGFATQEQGKIRFFAYCLFLLCLLFMFLYGEKFSGPAIAIIYFFSGCLIVSKNQKFSIFTLLFLAISISLFLLSIYLIWGLVDDRDISNIVTAFKERSARQAQAWWKLDEIAHMSRPDIIGKLRNGIYVMPIEIHLNYQNLSTFEHLGNQYIKYILMPKDEYDKHPGSFAAVYPAILYLNNSFYGLLCWALALNSIYWFIIIFIFHYSSFRYVILLFPAFVYWYTVHLKIFQSGNIYLLTHPKYILGLAVIVSIFFLIKSGTMQKIINLLKNDIPSKI